MRNLFLSIALAVTVAASCTAAHAAPVFVGSYAVFNGPRWETNPTVYSGQDAAALLFGGLPSDYLISIDPNTTDPTTITDTAWYDGWGEHLGMIFPQNYKLDVGNPGYNDPGGLDTARSAYVGDGLFDTNKFRNYVWRVGDERNDEPVVPEPTGLALLFTGGLPLVNLLRKRGV